MNILKTDAILHKRIKPLYDILYSEICKTHKDGLYKIMIKSSVYEYIYMYRICKRAWNYLPRFNLQIFKIILTKEDWPKRYFMNKVATRKNKKLA